MPYACWYLWHTNYIEDFKWRLLHFQFGVAIWRVVLREVYFEGPNRVWRPLTSNLEHWCTHKSLAYTLEYCILYFVASEKEEEAILNSEAYLCKTLNSPTCGLVTRAWNYLNTPKVRDSCAIKKNNNIFLENSSTKVRIYLHDIPLPNPIMSCDEDSSNSLSSQSFDATM